MIRKNPAEVRGMAEQWWMLCTFIELRKEDVLKIMAKYTRGISRSALERGYDSFNKLPVEDTYPTLEGIKNIFEIQATIDPKAAMARPEDFVDFAFSTSSRKAATSISFTAGAKNVSQRPASLDHGNRLYLEHHLRVRKLLDSDQSASRITALGEKASSQLRKTVAIFHINDKHSHRDNVVQRTAHFGENCADALETNSYLSVKLSWIRLAGFIAVTTMACQVNSSPSTCYNGW